MTEVMKLNLFTFAGLMMFAGEIGVPENALFSREDWDTLNEASGSINEPKTQQESNENAMLLVRMIREVGQRIISETRTPTTEYPTQDSSIQ